MTSQEKDKLIQAIYIDQSDLNQELADCFTNYLKLTNLRVRDYLNEKEFLLDFQADTKKVYKSTV